MVYTLLNNCFEHFLEFLADQSSSFGVSKLDFLSISVNHLAVCVGVIEHQKMCLILVILAFPHFLRRYCVVQVQCASILFIVRYIHSQSIVDGSCPVNKQTVSAIFPDQQHELEVRVWYNNQVRHVFVSK